MIYSDFSVTSKVRLSYGLILFNTDGLDAQLDVRAQLLQCFCGTFFKHRLVHADRAGIRCERRCIGTFCPFNLAYNFLTCAMRAARERGCRDGHGIVKRAEGC